jgi:type IV pilus assembly protein PilM
LTKGFAGLNLRRLLKLNQAEVLGLDIGSSAVKMVQLHKNSAGYTVTAAGIVEIADGTEDDKGRREVNIVGAISNCLKSTGVQSRLAVCGVCGPEVAVRYFKFPMLPPEEIEGAIMLEASQVCPFNVSDGAVDYQLIPDGRDNVSGVLVAATNEVIKRKIRLAKNASLDSVLMDVDGLALLNCFIECEKPDLRQTTAILNVGGSYTTLVIMGENALPFIRDMTYAGNDIIKHLATGNNISAEAVREILFGSQNSVQPKPELGNSLAGACQKLITNVTETLRYYTAQEKLAAVEKIYICGGFALVRGFVELLSGQLNISTGLWNPFDRIPCQVGRQCRDILQKVGPAMAVAAGLAMRSI